MSTIVIPPKKQKPKPPSTPTAPRKPRPLDPPPMSAAGAGGCGVPDCELEHYGDEGRHAPPGCQHSAQDWFLSETDNRTALRCTECESEER
jgi:hypothetical protein